jgi:hypothetical protein
MTKSESYSRTERENPRNGRGFVAVLRNQRQSVVLAKTGSERVERRTLRDGIYVIQFIGIIRRKNFKNIP